MNSRNVALCSVFVAIAIILDRFTIPFVKVSFDFWEIPLVIALLLFGYRFSLIVATVTVFAQALIFPRSLGLLFPVWNLVAISITLTSVALVQYFITKKAKGSLRINSEKKIILFLVLPALVVRVAVMPFIDYFMYKVMMPIVVGEVFTDATIIGLLPFWLIFNSVLILYTVPISYTIAKKVNRDLRMGNSLL
jgi:hypothetical protein